MKMREPSIEKRYAGFMTTLHHIYNELANLLEDPLFLDSIHGEQEMALDQTLELLESVMFRFSPVETTTQSEQERTLLELTAVDTE